MVKLVGGQDRDGRGVGGRSAEAEEEEEGFHACLNLCVWWDS